MSGVGLAAFWVIGAPLALTACIVTVIFIVEAMTNEARDLRHLHRQRRATLRAIRRDARWGHVMSSQRTHLVDLDRRIADATPKTSADV